MSKKLIFQELLLQFGAEKIIEALSPMLTDKRKERAHPVIDSRLDSLHIAVEDPSDIHNALAMVRTAEANGLMHMHLIGKPKKRQGKMTMKGADRWLNLQTHTGLESFFKGIKEKELLLFGAAPRGTALLEEVPVDRPFCVLFGNEMGGLTQQALNACDLTFRIPMHGFCESFNLSVSAGIVLYELTKKTRQHLGCPGNLTQSQKLEERARFYLETLGVEQGRKIVKQKLLISSS